MMFESGELFIFFEIGGAVDTHSRFEQEQRSVLGGCLLIVFLGAPVVAVLAAWIIFESIPSGPDYTSLQQEGDEIASRIRRYKDSKGHFPHDLHDIEGIKLSGGYGGWQYEKYEDDRGFRLSIGRYGEDGFVFFYSPGQGWYCDS